MTTNVFSRLAVGCLVFVGGLFLVQAQEFGQKPNEVQNVVATATDGQIDLTWDAADDPDGVVVGYKVYYGTTSVQTPEQSYDTEVTVGNVTAHTLPNLTDGVTYYIGVVAIDDEENLSDTYSVEVSATPGLADTAGNPNVVAVEQIANNRLRVTMSEPVVTTSPADAFLIEDAGTRQEFPVTDAQSEGSDVLVTVSINFSPGKTYRVVATSAVEDADGNPVSSGITDTITFQAQMIATPPPVEEEPVVQLPNIDSPIAPDNFEPVDLVPEPEQPDTVSPPAQQTGEQASEPFQSAPPVQDQTPPLDAMNLRVNADRLKSENVVVVSWTKALDIDGDVADQVLYTRQGLGQWDSGYSLGTDISEVELELDLNQNYEVRLVTVDQAGNESDGTVFAFSTNLSETGPGEVGTVIALMLAFFIGLLFVGKRRVA